MSKIKPSDAQGVLSKLAAVQRRVDSKALTYYEVMRFAPEAVAEAASWCKAIKDTLAAGLKPHRCAADPTGVVAEWHSINRFEWAMDEATRKAKPIRSCIAERTGLQPTGSVGEMLTRYISINRAILARDGLC